MSQNYVYPSSSTITIAAEGSNGAPGPLFSLEVAGLDGGGILRPISVDSAGVQNVNVLTLPPITGTVTANQGTPNTLANAWPVKLTDGTLSNTFTANGLKVDGSAVTQPVSAASLPLPTGAATSANQTLEIADLDQIKADIHSRLTGALVPTAFDEIDLTYVPSGNGAGQIATAVYKLVTVTVKTLTLTYDASNRISTVVAS